MQWGVGSTALALGLARGIKEMSKKIQCALACTTCPICNLCAADLLIT